MAPRTCFASRGPTAMSKFEHCQVGDKVRLDNGYPGEVVSVSAKRFCAKFAWPKPVTISSGDTTREATHFITEFRKSDGRSVGGKTCSWATPA